MFLIYIIIPLIFNTIRLFFIGYVIRLIFRNTNYGRNILVLTIIYNAFLIITNRFTGGVIFDLIASILSLSLYVYVYDRHKVFKPKKLKGMDTQFRTKHADQVFFIILTIVTWVFSIFIYISIGIDELLFIPILVSNIIAYVLIYSIKEEKVYLLVGKTEIDLYEYSIPKKIFKYSPADFFKSDDFIIDYVAVMYENRVKTHIYMLPVDKMQAALFSNANKIDIPHDILRDLKKYHFVSISFKEKTPRLKRLK